MSPRAVDLPAVLREAPEPPQSYETDAVFDKRPEPEEQQPQEEQQPEAGDWEDIFGGIPWIPFLP